jgi:hypothetical protein
MRFVHIVLCCVALAVLPKHSAPASCKISDDSTLETLGLPSDILPIKNQHKNKQSVSTLCQNQNSEVDLMPPPLFLPSSSNLSTFTLNNGSTHLFPTLRSNIPIFKTDYNRKTKFSTEQGFNLLLTGNNRMLASMKEELISKSSQFSYLSLLSKC